MNINLKVNLAILSYGLIVVAFLCFMLFNMPHLGLSEIKDVALVLTPIATLYITAFNIRHSNDIQAAARTAETAQAWLEKTFLAEGIEPIVQYLSTMARITNITTEDFVEPPFPTAALTRMTLLLRHDRLHPLVMMLSEEFKRASKKDNSKETPELLKLLKTHQKLTETLLELEGILLMCEIKGRDDVLLLHQLPEVKTHSEIFKTTFEEMFQDIVQRSEGKKPPRGAHQ